MTLDELIGDLSKAAGLHSPETEVVGVIVGGRSIQDGDILPLDGDVGIMFVQGKLVLSLLALEEDFD